MKKFYLLYHAYEFAENKEIKHLGLYSSLENAEKAKERYYKLSGFSEYPKNCFYISEFTPDTDEQWTDGFINSDSIAEDFRNLTITINEMAEIKKTPETSWQDEDYYYVLCEINALRFRTDNISELSEYIRKMFANYMGIKINSEICTRTAEKIMR
ncbi:MAG: hypothetical protein K2L10_06520 [Ruminococcus sp.]|nr:hypothetical protein [Ruminococcus sp.]